MSDPFAEVAEIIFGDGYFSKSNPDGADLSTKGKKKPKETPEWQKNVALATNAGGAIAAPAAIYQATRNRTEGGMPRAAMRSGKLGGKLKRTAEKMDAAAGFKPSDTPTKVPKSGSTKAKIAAGAAGATMIGLQGANAAGDTIAARMLTQDKKKKVEKGLDIPETEELPQNKGQLTRAVAMKGSDKVVAAHKSGKLKKLGKDVQKLPEKILTSRDKDVSKAWGKNTLNAYRLTRGNITRTTKNIEDSTAHLNSVANKVDRATGKAGVAALGGVGVGGAGVGYAVGNKQKKKVKKSASDDLDIRWEGEISKVDSDKQQVFGWASIVEYNGEPVVDLQGDYIAIDEVEKSAYEYVQKSRKGGDMHLRDEFGQPKVGSQMIESFVITPEKKQALNLPEETPTGWWVGYQINDQELWNKVKTGERTGFSIHGRGVRTPHQENS